jgi:hypothetical protein
MADGVNREFRVAILDTLLPGETAGPPDLAALPPASGLFDAAELPDPLAAAVDARCGGSAAFLALGAAARTDLLARLESDDPSAFRIWATPLLVAYYDHPAVLAAMGWRAEPPQPAGHAMPPTDRATEERLAKVARRSALWRVVE